MNYAILIIVALVGIALGMYIVRRNATAEQYLDELEKEGKIQQLGKTGRSVSYFLTETAQPR